MCIQTDLSLIAVSAASFVLPSAMTTHLPRKLKGRCAGKVSSMRAYLRLVDGLIVHDERGAGDGMWPHSRAAVMPKHHGRKMSCPQLQLVG
eukprot:23542-Eustigmatos_ZCMA.PRE.1